MYKTEYKTGDDNVIVNVTFYPVDGFRAWVMVWDDDNRSYHTAFDKRVIADSFWEGMLCVLTEALDIESEQADYLLAEWDIFPPSDDDEGDE